MTIESLAGVGVSGTGRAVPLPVSGPCVRENDDGPAQGQLQVVVPQSLASRVATGGADIAAALSLEHARLLRENALVSVQRLLVGVGMCPWCGGTLLSGERLAVCTDCGSEALL